MYNVYRVIDNKLKNIFLGMSELTEIVISGISGRFPECNSTEEFKQKLYNNADLLTIDNRRWSPGNDDLDY